MRKSFIIMVLITLTPLLAVPAASAAADFHVPVRVRMVLEKVTRLLDRHEYDQAITMLENFQCKGRNRSGSDQALSKRGYSHPLVDFYLGNCFLLQQQYRQAALAYEQALKKNPDFLSAWQNLAKAYYEQGQYEDAARCFLAVHERSADPAAETLYYAAVSFLLAQRYAESIQQFEKVFELHPEPLPLAWKEHYVQALLAAGQARRALPFLQELAAEATGAAREKWQEVLLYQYLQLDMRQEALAYATGLVHDDCTCAKWWKALVQVRLAAGQDQEAMAALTIYRFLTPLSDNEQKLWADLNLQLRIPTQALAGYQQLLEKQPDEKVVQNLILAYRQLGQEETALQQLERFLPRAGNIDLLMTKADLLYSLGRYVEAEEIYRNVAESDEKQAGQAWLMAGYAAWQHDDIEASLSAFDRAAENKKQRQAALAAIQKISQWN